MMPFRKKLLAVLSVTALLATVLFLSGCGDNDPGKAAKETVEELSGKNMVDKGERIKQQINDLSDQQVRAVQKQFDQEPEDQASGSPDNN